MNTPKRNYNSLVCFLTTAFIISLMVSYKTNSNNAGKAFLSPQHANHVTVSSPSAGQAPTSSATAMNKSVFI